MAQKAKKSDWIEWSGGNRPVKSSVPVEVELSDGRMDKGNAAHFLWQHYCSASDIIRYRVISEPTIKKKRIPTDIEALTAAITGAQTTIGQQGRLIRGLQSALDQGQKNYEETNKRLAGALLRIEEMELQQRFIRPLPLSEDA